MAKRHTSASGRTFTDEELRNVPVYEGDELDEKARLQYEYMHGVSPDERTAFIEKMDNELIHDTDVITDAQGNSHEQLKFNLDDEEGIVREREEEVKRKPSVTDRLSNIKDKIQFGAFFAMDQATDKMNEVKDNLAYTAVQANETTQDVVESSADKVNETVDGMKSKVGSSAGKVSETVDGIANKAAVRMYIAQDDIMDNLAEKHRLIAMNIEAKKHIKDFASGGIDKEKMAFLMANDPELHQSIQSVSHNMLHPSPIEGLKTARTNPQLDVGYGFSVFMEELQQPLDSEVEAIMEIDNMSMMVEMGQDKTIPPKARENYYMEAGVSEDDLATFVTRDDYRDYVTELEHKFRKEHMDRLGLNEDDTLDVEDENRVNELVEDSMSLHNEDDVFDYTMGQDGELANTYQETYNMSSEDMFRMFDNPDNYDMDFDTVKFPVNVDYDFEGVEFMRHSVQEYHALQDMTIEDSQAYLESVESEMQAYQEQMGGEYVSPNVEVHNVQPESVMDEQNIPPEPEVMDMYMAEEYNYPPPLEDYEPPILHEEDLAALNEQIPPELSDDDIHDLGGGHQAQQR